MTTPIVTGEQARALLEKKPEDQLEHLRKLMGPDPTEFVRRFNSMTAEEALAAARKGRKAIARHVPGQMNKNEARYALHLKLDQDAGLIRSYMFEAVTFKLGPDCRYTPDFMVIGDDGSVFLDDCKSYRKNQKKVHVEDDSRAKISVASEKFPWFIWRFCWQDSDGWKRRVIG